MLSVGESCLLFCSRRYRRDTAVETIAHGKLLRIMSGLELKVGESEAGLLTSILQPPAMPVHSDKY